MRTIPLSLLIIGCILAAASTAAANRIILQLPWIHQFQFAGYYAALEKGFYQEAGLDVIIKEGKPGMDALDIVHSGAADYGVSRSEIVLHKMAGHPVTVLATIFQKSAVIFLTTESSGITTPQDMVGKRVMLLEGVNAAEYLAVFQNEGIPLHKIVRQQSSYNIQDLIDGKTDVFNAYSTNEPFFLKQQNIPHTVIDPKDFGIDFYGDSLYTKQSRVDERPEEVKMFRQASLKGWQYALEHPEEIIDLLLTKYGVNKTRAHLQYEAQAIQELVMPSLVKIGHINPERWHHMAQTMVDLNLAAAPYSLDGFIYDPTPPPDRTWMLWSGAVLICIIILYTFCTLVFFNRRLQKNLTEQSKRLQRTERRFRELFNNMQDGVAIYEAIDNGQNFTFRDINPAGLKTSQVQKEAILNRRVTEVFPGVQEIGLLDVLQRVYQSGQSVNHPISYYNDEQRQLWVENYVCKLPGGEVVAIYTDSTEKRAAEKQLLRSKLEWEKTFNAMSDIVTLQDMSYRIFRANKAAYDFFQLQPGELEGRYCYELFSGSDEPCALCPQKQSVHKGHPHSANICHDLSGCIFYVSTARVHSEEGKDDFIVHVAKDVTKQKQLEEELFQAHKQEAIGTLASGIAHDFNNILSGIIGCAELAAKDVSHDSIAGKELAEINGLSKRASELIRQILVYGRKDKREMSHVQLPAVVKDALRLIHSTLPSSITIKEDIDQQCGVVLAHEVSLHQVIMNLCTNAARAMQGEPGDLIIRLYKEELDEAMVIGKEGVVPGEYAVLQVSDSGKGMEEQTVERIFEPYYTTREQGEGTGLGLAVIHGIIQEHKGFIKVVSRLGKGSSFFIYLPLTEGKVKKVEQPHHSPQTSALANKHKHILVVDDEELLVRINKKRLEGEGYQVTAIADSKEALAVFTHNKDTFDLLITDQTMPGMTGAELAKQVLSMRPDFPIIMCTGHSDTFHEADAQELGISQYIYKPLKGDELLQATKEVLAKAEPAAKE